MTKNPKPTNTKKEGPPTRDERGRWLKGTPPPNPGGRPPEGESWSGLYKTLGDKTPAELAAMVGGADSELGQRLLQLKRANAPMKIIVVLNAYLAAANDPQPGILKEIADRGEGKVPDVMEAKHEINPEQFEDILKVVYGRKRS